MRKIIFLFILLFSIYLPSIAQIDGFRNLSINKHYFPDKNDSLSISVSILSDDIESSTLRCKAIFSSGSYKIGQDYKQDILELELNYINTIDSTLNMFSLSIPINIFKSGRYTINLLATDNNWQSIEYFKDKNDVIPPITVGMLGLIQAYSKLSVSDDTLKFAFLDFDNNLDITSNKLEGIYTQGFCNNELVSFNGFKFHLWKDKSLTDIDFSLFYSIDGRADVRFSDFKISDNSSDGKISFINKYLEYPFYVDENIEDFTIDIDNVINDLINKLILSDNEFHNISFRFVLKIDSKIIQFPDEGKLSYDFKVYDLPTGADCQAALLPIDLLKWETHLKKKIVYFEWITVSEINNNIFDVQKSNNFTDWKTIATIKGNGTTNNTNKYSTSDNFPYAGQNFYRLRQSDFDGNFKYSKVKSVYVFDNKINLFPNPTTDYIYYTFSDYTKEFKIEIFDTQGRIVTKVYLPLKSGTKNRIDIRHLKKGTYFLKYYNLENHRVQVHTFVKI